VLAQDYPAIEYIVVDGGSTDGSVEIIRRYADRLAWWVSEPDGGQTDAIDKGFRRATGDAVGWLNSDDLLPPNAVSEAVAALEADPSLGFVYRDCECIDAEGRHAADYPTRQHDATSLLLEANPIAQPTVLMRRAALEAVGGLDTRLHYLMDFDLWLRIAARTPIQHVPGIGAKFRLHADSKTIAKSAEFWVEAIAHLEDDQDLSAAVGAPVLAEGIRRLHVRAALDHFHAGDLDRFGSHFASALQGDSPPWGERGALADNLLFGVVRPQYEVLPDAEAASRLRRLVSALAPVDRETAGRLAQVAAFWSAQRGLDTDAAWFGARAVRFAPGTGTNRGLVKATGLGALRSARDRAKQWGRR